MTSDSSSSGSWWTKRKVIGAISGGVILLLVGLGIWWWTWARSASSSIVRVVETTTVGWVFFWVLLGVFIWAVWSWYESNYSTSDHGRHPAQGTVAVLLLLALGTGVFFYGWMNRYETGKAYLASVSYTKGSLPDYDFRAPLPQADNLLHRNQGDCVGNAQPVTYVMDKTSARWTSVVDGTGQTRHMGCVISWDGTGQESTDFTVCPFAGVTRAIDGDYGNNLNRLLQHYVPRGTWFDPSDAYGDCAGPAGAKKAVLYIPMLENSGLVHAHMLPAGLVVVKSNANIRYYPNVKAGQFPGPVYPKSVTAAQEAANTSHAGFSEYRAGTGGFETAGGGANTDKLDPNLGNQSEFLLRNSQTRRAEFVTPLTPIGSGQQIIAASRIVVDSVSAGHLNPLQIVRFDTDRPANATAAQQIRSSYATDLPWANASLELLEITPGAKGDWYATIGRKLDLMYVVHIKADDSSTLYDFHTGQVLAAADANGNPVGGPSSTAGSGTPGAPAPADLTGMATKDLISLRDQVQAVLDQRALAGSVPAPKK